MVTLAEIEAQAINLTVLERATLAKFLLRSLPPLMDEDGGVAEALRRDAEMDADPSACMTYEEFKSAVAR